MVSISQADYDDCVGVNPLWPCLIGVGGEWRWKQMYMCKINNYRHEKLKLFSVTRGDGDESSVRKRKIYISSPLRLETARMVGGRSCLFRYYFPILPAPTAAAARELVGRARALILLSILMRRNSRQLIPPAAAAPLMMMAMIITKSEYGGGRFRGWEFSAKSKVTLADWLWLDVSFLPSKISLYISRDSILNSDAVQISRTC